MGPEDGFSLGELIGGLIALLVVLVPYVKIIRKAGYSGWWFLTAFVPFLNLVMLWVFAFADWPNLRRTDPL